MSHFPTDAAHSFFRNYTPYRLISIHISLRSADVFPVVASGNTSALRRQRTHPFSITFPRFFFSVESVFLNGTGRRSLGGGVFSRVYLVSILGEFIFWAESDPRRIVRANKVTAGNPVVVATPDHVSKGLQIFAKERQNCKCLRTQAMQTSQELVSFAFGIPSTWFFMRSCFCSEESLFGSMLLHFKYPLLCRQSEYEFGLTCVVLKQIQSFICTSTFVLSQRTNNWMWSPSVSNGHNTSKTFLVFSGSLYFRNKFFVACACSR